MPPARFDPVLVGDLSRDPQLCAFSCTSQTKVQRLRTLCPFFVVRLTVQRALLSLNLNHYVQGTLAQVLDVRLRFEVRVGKV